MTLEINFRGKKHKKTQTHGGKGQKHRGTKNKRNKKFSVDVCMCVGRYKSVYIYIHAILYPYSYSLAYLAYLMTA